MKSSLSVNEYQQAQALFQAGRYEAALECLWRCLSANPLGYKYQRMFIKAAAPILAKQYLTQGKRLEVEGRFHELVSLYDQALKLRLDPPRFKKIRREAKQIAHEFDGEFQLAQDLWEQEKYIKFQRQVDKLLEMAPQNWEVQALLSQTQRLGNSRLAEETVGRNKAQPAPPSPVGSAPLEPTGFAIDKPKAAPNVKGKSATPQATELSLEDSIQLLEDLESSPEDK